MLREETSSWKRAVETSADLPHPIAYDLATDDFQPVTQEIVDRWCASHQRVARVMFALREEIASAMINKTGIPPDKVASILAMMKHPV